MSAVQQELGATGADCEVCDLPDHLGPLEIFHHDVFAHLGCVPAHWTSEAER